MTKRAAGAMVSIMGKVKITHHLHDGLMELL
jgi:hypothetical protein